MTEPSQGVTAPAGDLQLLTGFTSAVVRPRDIVIWRPPSSTNKQEQGHPVIYAHDGQNLFCPETAFAGVAWGVDEALLRLAPALPGPLPLVVGIWNTPDRYREYDPQRVFQVYLSPREQRAYAEAHGRPCSDAYLTFIVQELKPYIDRHYPTRAEREATFLLGSSMGGLISAYALCEYPEVFGAAACLSTHWPALQGRTADYLADRLPAPGRHRLYFDYGTETVDAQYEPYQRQVDTLLRRAGYRQGEDWLTRKFPGAEHSERAWRQRLDVPLRFLLS